MEEHGVLSSSGILNWSLKVWPKSINFLVVVYKSHMFELLFVLILNRKNYYKSCKPINKTTNKQRKPQDNNNKLALWKFKMLLTLCTIQLINSDVHWTIPDHTTTSGSPAFCLAVVNNWQYNIFKTGSIDSDTRLTVLDLVNRWTTPCLSCNLTSRTV